MTQSHLQSYSDVRTCQNDIVFMGISNLSWEFMYRFFRTFISNRFIFLFSVFTAFQWKWANLPVLKYTRSSLNAFLMHKSNVPECLWQFSKILTNSGWMGKCELCWTSNSFCWYRWESHWTLEINTLSMGTSTDICRFHILLETAILMIIL